MRNLKHLFFGLLAILATSVVFISCAHEGIEDKPEFRESVYLTQDIYDEGEDFVTEVLSKSTESTILKFHNNYIVANALVEMEEITEVIKNEPYGFHFSDVNLNNYLTVDQVSFVKSLLISDIADAQADELKGGCPCPPGQWCVGHWNNGWWKHCH